MEQLVLKAQYRGSTTKGQNKRLRLEGKLSGVVYGKKKEAISLQMDSADLVQAISTTAGSNILLNLVISGDKEEQRETVMVKELTRDIMRKNVLTHVDFIRVSMQDKIEVKVALNLTGESVGIKEGGVLQVQARDVVISTFPTDIPEEISVDITSLQVGDSLTVGDIELPSGAEMVSEPDTVIMSILAPRMVEEEKSLEEIEGAEVELTEETTVKSD